MSPESPRVEIGCLVIEELTSGSARLTGLVARLRAAGVPAETFRPSADSDLYVQLQAACHGARAGGRAGLVGLGTGAWAALALAAQAPVERLVLIDGGGETRPAGIPTALRRQVGRVVRFAERNLSLCVADALLFLPAERTASRRAARLRGAMANSRLRAVAFAPETAGLDVLWAPALHFLQAGELPKSLAENPEMCIIYE